RRAMAPRAAVAPANVAHDIDAGALGDDRRFAELPRRMLRFVPDRLAVRADGANLVARDASVGDDADRRLGQPAAEIESEPTVLLRCAAGERLPQASMLLAGVRRHPKGEQRGAVLLLRARHAEPVREADDGGRYPVE